jgi:hypothetical protein
MLMFTRAVPWVLKACTVCAVVMRAYSSGGATGRPERVLAAVAFFTFASVLPSIVSSVVDRATTTAYIVQSALFLVGMHATIVVLERLNVPEYSVAVTQTCILHMLWSQFDTLQRRKHVLIYQEAVQTLLCVFGLLSWCVCVLMLPHLAVDIFVLGGLMFVGEVLGVAVSLVAMMVAVVGNVVEAWLTER